MFDDLFLDLRTFGIGRDGTTIAMNEALETFFEVDGSKTGNGTQGALQLGSSPLSVQPTLDHFLNDQELMFFSRTKKGDIRR